MMNNTYYHVVGSQQEKDYSPVLTPDPLSVHFSNFVMTVEEYLEKCLGKLDACKRICCNLTVGGDSGALLFNNEQLSKIIECSSFRELFTLLRQHWNWKEFSILESIIVKSESDDAMFALQRFKQVKCSNDIHFIVNDHITSNSLLNVMESYNTVVLYKGIINVRKFWPKNITPKPV